MLLISTSLAVFITALSVKDRTRYKNDFVRIVPTHAADFVSKRQMNKNVSLVGVADNRIYLRDRLRNSLFALNLDLQDSSSIVLSIPERSEILIDSPYLYVQIGSEGYFQRRTLQSSRLDSVYRGLPGFTAIQPISDRTAVLRTVDMNQRKSVFVKSSRLDHEIDILEKQVDGILCTDGFLQYSKEYYRLIYTYRYRNQFISLDTNLNVLLKGKTIDTTSLAKISVAEVDGKITMSKPPFVVNKGTWVDGAYLFVHSNLVAKNESADKFVKRSVIDVYSIIDGSYRFSFYIDHINGSRMQNFRVRDGLLVATFPGYIARYDIPKKYLAD